MMIQVHSFLGMYKNNFRILSRPSSNAQNSSCGGDSGLCPSAGPVPSALFQYLLPLSPEGEMLMRAIQTSGCRVSCPCPRLRICRFVFEHDRGGKGKRTFASCFSCCCRKYGAHRNHRGRIRGPQGCCGEETENNRETARGLELGGATIAPRRWASKKEASTRVLLTQMPSYETKKDLRKQSKPVGVT